MVSRLSTGREREEIQWIREEVVGGWKYIHWGMEGLAKD
jgi:hypothetical protein